MLANVMKHGQQSQDLNLTSAHRANCWFSILLGCSGLTRSDQVGSGLKESVLLQDRGQGWAPELRGLLWLQHRGAGAGGIKAIRREQRRLATHLVAQVPLCTLYLCFWSHSRWPHPGPAGASGILSSSCPSPSSSSTAFGHTLAAL